MREVARTIRAVHEAAAEARGATQGRTLIERTWLDRLFGAAAHRDAVHVVR